MQGAGLHLRTSCLSDNDHYVALSVSVGYLACGPGQSQDEYLQPSTGTALSSGLRHQNRGRQARMAQFGNRNRHNGAPSSAMIFQWSDKRFRRGNMGNVPAGRMAGMKAAPVHSCTGAASLMVLSGRYQPRRVPPVAFVTLSTIFADTASMSFSLSVSPMG